jgi:purine nucleoside permease
VLLRDLRAHWEHGEHLKAWQEKKTTRNIQPQEKCSIYRVNKYLLSCAYVLHPKLKKAQKAILRFYTSQKVLARQQKKFLRYC